LIESNLFYNVSFVGNLLFGTMSVDMVKNLKAKLHLPNWTGSMRIPKKQIEQFSEVS